MMKASKHELITHELDIMRLAREERNRDLGLTTLYNTVKILAAGTRFQADCLILCREMDALWDETRPGEAPP